MQTDSIDISYANKVFSFFDYSSRLGRDKIDDLIGTSIEYGKAKAFDLIEEYGDSLDIVQEACLKEGLSVGFEKKPSCSKDFVKFAQCTVKDKEIMLNGYAIKTIADNFDDLDFEDIKNAVVAHELYHYMEFRHWGYLYKRYTFERKLLGLFKVRYSILPMSEVAANSFAKELLHLSFNPYELNSRYFSCV